MKGGGMMVACQKAAKVQERAAKAALEKQDQKQAMKHLNAAYALWNRAAQNVPPPPTDDLGGTPAAGAVEPERKAA